MCVRCLLAYICALCVTLVHSEASIVPTPICIPLESDYYGHQILPISQFIGDHLNLIKTMTRCGTHDLD